MGLGGLDWSPDRVASIYHEARAVIESQNETMADIDEKAMRTVRFNVLVVGVLLTAAEVAGAGGRPRPASFHPFLLSVAVLTLLLSVVLGVVTYNESDLYVGLDGHYIEVLVRAEPGDRRADREVLRTFAGMISENAEEIAWNSKLLTLTQASLVLGVLKAVAAVVF